MFKWTGLKKSIIGKNIFRIIVIILIAAFLALKIPSLAPVYVGSDEQLYSQQSLAIYKNPANIFLPELNEIYYPLLAAIGAPLNAFFMPPIPLKIVSVGFGLIALLFTYLIGKKLFSEKTGLAAVAFMLLSPIFFTYFAAALSDIPIMALSTIAIYLLITFNKKKALVLAGTLLAMYLIKTTSMIVLPAVAIFLMLKYKHKLNKRAAVIIFAGLVAIIAASFFFSPYKLYFVFDKITGASNYGSFLLKMMENFLLAFAGTATLVFALTGAILLRKRLEANVLLLQIWIVSIGCILLVAVMQHLRYYFLILPAIAIIAGYGLVTLIEKKKYRVLALNLAIVLLLVFAIINFNNNVLYFRSRDVYTENRWTEMAQWFKENIGEESNLIILIQGKGIRGVNLSAEIAFENPRKQTIDNLTIEEFEQMIQNETNYFVIRKEMPIRIKDEIRHWLYNQEVEYDEYLALQGFEWMEEFLPDIGSIFTGTYHVYKKTK